MNVLITGSKGQLGSSIKELSSEYLNCIFFFEDSKSLDITNFEEVKEYVYSRKIKAIINCAAYTLVDKAEVEKEKARKVNFISVSNLVKVIESLGGKLIHISTDYVFKGDACMPYKEEDNTDPVNFYGETKLQGEKEILESSIESIIIRTSWLYSEYGANFVKTILRLGEEKEKLTVIDDQIGSPTYARDLAKVCLDILKNRDRIDRKSKVYHYSNEGVSSWYDFAKMIIEVSGLQSEVIPIKTKDYLTLAKRPNYSLLDKSKIKEDFNIEIPHWRDSLKRCLNRIKNK